MDHAALFPDDASRGDYFPTDHNAASSTSLKHQQEHFFFVSHISSISHPFLPSPEAKADQI